MLRSSLLPIAITFGTIHYIKLMLRLETSLGLDKLPIGSDRGKRGKPDRNKL
jgi:hypothetical protein